MEVVDFKLVLPLLKVYADGSLISTLCGRMSLEELRSSVNPSLLSSSGGCLNLSFSADYSNTERHTGFRGFYTIQGEGQNVQQKNGRMQTKTL